MLTQVWHYVLTTSLYQVISIQNWIYSCCVYCCFKLSFCLSLLQLLGLLETQNICMIHCPPSHGWHHHSHFYPIGYLVFYIFKFKPHTNVRGKRVCGFHLFFHLLLSPRRKFGIIHIGTVGDSMTRVCVDSDKTISYIVQHSEKSVSSKKKPKWV